MPTLNPLDYVVIGCIAAVAAAPLLLKAARAAAGGIKLPSIPGLKKLGSPREKWVNTLMQLQSELESDPKQEQALKLCRQLIWQLLGGGPVA